MCISLNQLLDAGHETQLSMVVIDEVHMLSDNQRGYLLEVTLSKIKFLLRNSVQCVGMSATLPNLLDLAHWLDAALYTTSFRPVNLSVYLSCERSVYQCNQSSQPSIPGITTSFTDATNEPNIDLIPVRKVRIFDPSVVPVNSDPDAVVSLCLETVLQRKSVMLFCPSKDLCQKNARRIAESVYKLKAFVAAPLSAPTSASQTIAPIASQTVHHDSNFGSNYGSRSSSRIGAFTTQPSPFIYDSDEMDDETNDASTGSIPTAKYNVPTYGINNSSQLSRVAVGGNSDSNNSNNNSNSDNSSTTISASLAVDPPEIRSGRQRLLYQLQQCSIRLCSVLKETILQGVAYHHAGLTGEERRIIESGFRDGFINVLCATSTLAAGVNLPTHRAIIRSPKMGLKDLSVAEFRQMCGRAGRLNLDTNGEAILIIRKDEMRRGKHLVCADIEPLKSALHLGVGGGVQKLLLEMICCGRLVKMQDVEPFIRCTLMNAQNSSNEV